MQAPGRTRIVIADQETCDFKLRMKTFHLVGTTIAAVALLMGGGCATQHYIPENNSSALTDEESTLIAFSVSSTDSHFLQGMDLVIAGQQQAQEKVIKIPVSSTKKSEQVYLFKLPIDGARFGLVRFNVQGERWETVELGPEIAGTPGSLTYLGRIQTYSFQMEKAVDTGRRYPTGVKFLISDAGGEDLPRLEARYAMLSTIPVVKDIPFSWSDSDFAELRYRHVAGRRDLSQYFGPVGPEIPVGRNKAQ
jgi:hypothetical protein